MYRIGHRTGARHPKRLILQAADYAEHKAPAPRELEIYFEWTTYNTPYHPGGLVDQPYALMRRIRAARNVHEAIKTWKESKDWGKVQREQPDLWSIIETVVEMREAHGRY
jgi:hypothetical protein